MKDTVLKTLVSVGAAVVLLTGSVLLPDDASFQPCALARLRKSALGQLMIENRPRMYFPTRMIIGTETKFVVRAPIGNKVVLFLSPSPGGFATPKGQPLRVGPENQKLEAMTNDKGVAVFKIPVPDNPKLEGSKVFVDGYTYLPVVLDEESTVVSENTDEPSERADSGAAKLKATKSLGYKNMVVLQIVDPRGRPALGNKLAIQTRPDRRGSLVLPGAGGTMGAKMIQRLSTLSDIQKGGERVKELIDDGTMRRDTLQDRNVFIQRTDSLSTPGL